MVTFSSRFPCSSGVPSASLSVCCFSCFSFSVRFQKSKGWTAEGGKEWLKNRKLKWIRVEEDVDLWRFILEEPEDLR